jgi:hypothetical protein
MGLSVGYMKDFMYAISPLVQGALICQMELMVGSRRICRQPGTADRCYWSSVQLQHPLADVSVPPDLLITWYVPLHQVWKLHCFDLLSLSYCGNGRRAKKVLSTLVRQNGSLTERGCETERAVAHRWWFKTLFITSVGVLQALAGAINNLLVQSVSVAFFRRRKASCMTGIIVAQQ